jgi:aspartyl/asparaginyl-tRNA synthetase
VADNPAPRVFVRDLPKHEGVRVVLCGWAVTLRRAKALRFLVVRDRGGTVQVVCRPGTGSDLDGLSPESAVRVTGRVRRCTGDRADAWEIAAERVDVLAHARAPLPLDGRTDTEVRLDHRYLDLRSRDNQLVFEVQTTFEAAVRQFLRTHDFIEIHSPKITAGGSESGAAVFQVPYFGQTACLVQSPQFYMQLAMAAGFDRVFEVGPVFRAEPAVTNRHATEFTGIDIELSWIDSAADLMALEEELLRHALGVVRDIHGDDIRRYRGIDVEVPAGPIPRVPVAEAAETFGTGRLTHRDEQALCKRMRDRHGHSFVFLVDYPAPERPFYTMRDDTAGTSRGFDLLWRGIEVTSGCQREHRYDRLRAQIAESIAESTASTDGLGSYLDTYYSDMFRYGCPPHGGFGIGLNRLLMAMLGLPAIRDASLVFRGPGRYVP